MDNSSCRSAYISKILGNGRFSQSSAQPFESLWKRIALFEKEHSKSLEDGYTREDYVHLLNNLNAFDLDAFRTYKSIIRKYIEHLVKNGMLSSSFVDEIIGIKFEDMDAKKKFQLRYFKDFPSLQEHIDVTLRNAKKTDNRVFAMQISAIYLAWCGLTIEEALDLKKSDVLNDRVRVGDKFIYPNQTIMKYLLEYRDAAEYHSMSKAVITFQYVPSEWLFRSSRSEHIPGPKAMRIAINAFCKSAGGDNNLFNYDKIYDSGVFHRAYLYELENGRIPYGDLNAINAAFHTDFPNTAKANIFLKQYWQFAAYFFPQE